jgi:hypothetical protein
MPSTFAFTTAPSQETLSNEAIAGLILVCIAINACTRSSSAKTWVSAEEEEQELSHPAPVPAPAPAPKQHRFHEGLAESVQAVLRKTPQTAREICSKLSDAYPILTKSEVNSCLYTLSSKKQAKQVYSPNGTPRWTNL